MDSPSSTVKQDEQHSPHRKRHRDTHAASRLHDKERRREIFRERTSREHRSDQDERRRHHHHHSSSSSSSLKLHHRTREEKDADGSRRSKRSRHSHEESRRHRDKLNDARPAGEQDGGLWVEKSTTTERLEVDVPKVETTKPKRDAWMEESGMEVDYTQRGARKTRGRV